MNQKENLFDWIGEIKWVDLMNERVASFIKENSFLLITEWKVMCLQPNSFNNQLSLISLQQLIKERKDWMLFLLLSSTTELPKGTEMENQLIDLEWNGPAGEEPPAHNQPIQQEKGAASFLPL